MAKLIDYPLLKLIINHLTNDMQITLCWLTSKIICNGQQINNILQISIRKKKDWIFHR